MLNGDGSNWPIERTLLGATTPGQSEPGSDGNRGVLRILQSFSVTGASPSGCLVSYQDTRWGSLTPLQRSSRCILQPQPNRPCYFSVLIRASYSIKCIVCIICIMCTICLERQEVFVYFSVIFALFFFIFFIFRLLYVHFVLFCFVLFVLNMETSTGLFEKKMFNSGKL